MTHSFPKITFKGKLRPNQRRAVAAIKAQLAAGERQLHIVAPPGSGKTVLGLYVWARCVRAPAVVLSPTSAIQMQWLSRAELFTAPKGDDRIVSPDASPPGLLTSLTYQAITLPRRGGAGDDIEETARELWLGRLVDEGHAEDAVEARAWIDGLEDHNPPYFKDRMGVYRKQAIEEMTRGGRSLDALHASARQTIESLRDREVGLVILDECHHLLGHWGRVLGDAASVLDGPVVLGLTATTPDLDRQDERDAKRYHALLGDVDYEVPIPAVVKEGHLAPYQDLVQFVRPTAKELQFIAKADEALEALIASLTRAEPVEDRLEPLLEWLASSLGERRLATGQSRDWATFLRRDGRFADAARLFLEAHGRTLPGGVPPIEPGLRGDPPPLEAIIVTVLDRYVRAGLRRSASTVDHEIASVIVRRLRVLGFQITETGVRRCAAPVTRVLAYSRSKCDALVRILRREHRLLGSGLRAVVVCDYETTSAERGEAATILDKEAGGAIAAFRAIVSDPEADNVDPILVTGSSVLVDDDLAPRFLEAMTRWIDERGADASLSTSEHDGFVEVHGRGGDWAPRLYVALITRAFQEGLARCLVGTRGLLGEGWDASRTNVLVDLTAVTTSTSVNQLRGRSIRLDAHDPKKMANNWDVICIAQEFSGGLGDYERFRQRHESWYGVTEDGAIEKGVGHVHPAFTDAQPEHIAELMEPINQEMLERAALRDEARKRWRIGKRFRGEATGALEVHPGLATGGAPLVESQRGLWSDESLIGAVARAVVGALAEAQLVGSSIPARAGARAGGYIRLVLEGAQEDDRQLALEAIGQALGPLERPRYVIPRQVEARADTLLSKLLPSVLGRFFQRRSTELAMLHAVPDALARTKDLAQVYERHWNEHVSPGQAVYAHHGAGESLLLESKAKGRTALHTPRGVELFV